MDGTKKKRLHEVMKILGLSDYRVYTDVPDISKNMMTKLRNGETKEASSKVLEPFCKHYESVNPTWLLTGTGSMFRDTVQIIGDSNTTTQNNGNQNVTHNNNTNNYNGCPTEEPKISYKAGSPYYNVDFIAGFDAVLNDQTINPEYNIDFAPYNKKGVMWCNITGKSMEPKISHGDIIAIKEVDDWQNFLTLGEIYAIVTANDMRTVKIIRKGITEDTYRLIPINTNDFDEQEINKKMIVRVFAVLGCMKRI